MTKWKQSHVRQAIENRLEDQSPAVRDAAVELVGKYVVQSPALATEYYPQIALRAAVSIGSFFPDLEASYV